MGGKNEKTIETKVSAAPGKATTIGKLRIHENKGEVHFHDDDNGLKVAVPSAMFWRAWNNNVNLNSIQFFDSERETLCTIRFCVKNSAQDVDAEIILTKTSVNDSFKKLNDFAMGR
jgi:hypothetical protein